MASQAGKSTALLFQSSPPHRLAPCMFVIIVLRLCIAKSAQPSEGRGSFPRQRISLNYAHAKTVCRFEAMNAKHHPDNNSYRNEPAADMPSPVSWERLLLNAFTMT